ncbi:hypothetical protein [Streptomyces sp. NPDC059708]|uniref:hypothetical protein n=1 Tax=Streptomyces sp. NPDC059708 TaxID=3346916 RepID=UPI0036783D68
MSAHPHPRLEGPTPTPAGISPAEPAPAKDSRGAPKVVAEGVLSVLRRSDQFTNAAGPRSLADPTPERPGIRISAAPVYRHHHDGARWSHRYADTPTATYACRCGQTRTATGQHAVAALVAEYDHHRDLCPQRATATTQERRKAA